MEANVSDETESLCDARNTEKFIAPKQPIVVNMLTFNQFAHENGPPIGEPLEKVVVMGRLEPSTWIMKLNKLMYTYINWATRKGVQ